MKKVIFTLLTFSALSFNASAQYCGTSNPSGPNQCSPSGTLDKPGLKPDTDSLPPVINAQAVTTVIQFKNFDTLRAFGNLLTIQTLEIDSINNLPSGLCWATSTATNRWNNQEDGCIKINGTACVDPGVYRLKIKVLADVGLGFAVPYDADQVGLKYYVRVINNGDAEVALDTSQTAFFAKPAGYSATAICNVGVNEVSNTVSSLSVVPNPFNNKAVVSFSSDVTGVMTERITNMLGSVVHLNELDVRLGDNTSTINREDLPAGVYFYSLSTGKNVITKRIVISE